MRLADLTISRRRRRQRRGLPRLRCRRPCQGRSPYRRQSRAPCVWHCQLPRSTPGPRDVPRQPKTTAGRAARFERSKQSAREAEVVSGHYRLEELASQELPISNDIHPIQTHVPEKRFGNSPGA